MQLMQHFNDLTEIHHMRVFASTPLDTLQKMEALIKTRIAFTDCKPTTYPETAQALDEAGWKIATKTLDWHDWHGGDSELRLYYKLFPHNNSDVADKRERGSCGYPCHQSLNGSCSMGLVNGIDHKKWMISKNNPHKYLTLIRLDRKPTPKEIAEMKYYRYRLVFRSDVARYFANGWKPNEWPGSKKAEHDWWANSPDAPSMNGFPKNLKGVLNEGNPVAKVEVGAVQMGGQ